MRLLAAAREAITVVAPVAPPHPMNPSDTAPLDARAMPSDGFALDAATRVTFHGDATSMLTSTIALPTADRRRCRSASRLASSRASWCCSDGWVAAAPSSRLTRWW